MFVEIWDWQAFGADLCKKVVLQGQFELRFWIWTRMHEVSSLCGWFHWRADPDHVVGSGGQVLGMELQVLWQKVQMDLNLNFKHDRNSEVQVRQEERNRWSHGHVGSLRCSSCGHTPGKDFESMQDVPCVSDTQSGCCGRHLVV